MRQHPPHEDLRHAYARKLEDGGGLLGASRALCHTRRFCNGWSDTCSPGGLSRTSTLWQHHHTSMGCLSLAWKPILWFVKGGDGTLKHTSTMLARAMNSPTRRRTDEAQTIACARYYIRWLTRPGDVVVDPFAGSGTTLITSHMEATQQRWFLRSRCHVLTKMLSDDPWMPSQVSHQPHDAAVIRLQMRPVRFPRRGCRITKC